MKNNWALFVLFFFLMWELFMQSNPENTVGILTMAGKGVRVLVTPTSDLGKILACMHGKSLFLYCVDFLDNFLR